jgi:hypothetical protein
MTETIGIIGLGRMGMAADIIKVLEHLSEVKTE